MPFVVTIVAALLFSLYMVLDPGTWLVNIMQLTEISLDFKFFVLILALGGFFVAWIGEKHLFIWVARLLGKARSVVWPQSRKVRKQYKMILEDIRI